MNLKPVIKKLKYHVFLSLRLLVSVGLSVRIQEWIRVGYAKYFDQPMKNSQNFGNIQCYSFSSLDVLYGASAYRN